MDIYITTFNHKLGVFYVLILMDYHFHLYTVHIPSWQI